MPGKDVCRRRVKVCLETAERRETHAVDLAKEALETLRSAKFPVFAVPRSRWAGDVIVGRTWGNTKHPLSVTMRYDDDLLIEHPTRRIEITSTGPEGLSHRAPDDAFLLWEHSYSSAIINLVHNIRGEVLPERPIPGSERFNAEMVDGRMIPRTVHLPSAGRRRLIDVVPFIGGYQMECVAFDEKPKLRLYRAQMLAAEVVMLAWGWDDDEELRQFITSARPIKDDEGLFAEIERAEYAAWRKIRERDRGEDPA